jgi:hypothetical protein
MARCRKILERKHIGKIEAIPAVVSLDFFNAFAAKRLRQMAIPYSGFRVEAGGNPLQLRTGFGLFFAFHPKTEKGNGQFLFRFSG